MITAAWASWWRLTERVQSCCTSLSVALVLAVALLSACGGSGGSGGSSTSPDAYGGPLNHAHDFLVLRGMPQVALLATHTGLYRSNDGGETWTQIAGGTHQVMDGLMFNTLAQSPQEVRRVYVLAIPRVDDPSVAHAEPGIYMSSDAGSTWALATPLSAFPAPVFTIGVGSAAAGQLFALIRSLGSKGLYMSPDEGSHWQALPPVPTTTPSGIEGDPAIPQRILLWSVADGLFTSDDAGKSWQAAAGAQGGVWSVTLTSATLYASGDCGLYVSQDGGVHLSLLESNTTFDTVVAASAAPATAYALTGGGVYTSGDGGRTWQPTAATSRKVTVVAVDPNAPRTVFACLVDPLGVDMSTDGGATWKQVLP